MKYVIGLGTNRGDRLGYLRAGFKALKSFARPLAVSRIYESDAMLPEGAPADWNSPFLNCAVLCETKLSPVDLLTRLKSIEKSLGRSNRERWSPRELDLDILAADEPVPGQVSSREALNPPLEHARLEIPHAGLRERPFALLPLADVWPAWKTPWGKSAREEAAAWRWSSNPPFGTKRTGLSLTELMGIVNVTPDSFSSDGLLSPASNTAADRATQLIERHLSAGCTLIDIGAESTRPGGEALTADEEWARLEPIFKSVLPKFRAQPRTHAGSGAQPRPQFSLDSRHPENAERALEYGVDWLNDVTGFTSAPMVRAATRSGKVAAAMHSLTVPVRKDVVLSDDVDPLEQILTWGHEKIEKLERAGIARGRIVLDPGIGFGKTPRQNLYLLQNARRFHEWGVGLLIGHSRKSFMNELTRRPAAERDFETAIFSAKLAEAGVEYLRVHDSEISARAIATGGFLE